MNEKDRFKVGDVIEYGFFSNITIYKIDNQYYYLRDKVGNIRLVYKSIINKHAKKVEVQNVK